MTGHILLFRLQQNDHFNDMAGTNLKNKQQAAVLLIIILLGFGLRVWQLDAQPLRGDESFSMVVWMDQFAETFRSLATVDPQPPGALLWFYGWIKLVGSTVFAARYQAVLTSTLTIAAIYTLGKLLVDEKTGLLAAFLVAINPYQVWFAQDARSVAVWTCTSVLTTWFMLRSLKQPGKLNNWLLYILFAALGMYFFYLEAFVILFHNLYALASSLRNRKLLLRWFAGQLGIALLIALWYAQPRLWLNNTYQPTAGPVHLPWAFQSFSFGETFPAPLQLEPLTTAPHGLLIYAAFILVFGGLLIIWRRKPINVLLFTVLYAFLALILLSVFEVVTQGGYFRPRYLASSAPAWLLLLAVSLAAISDYPRKAGVFAAGGVLILLTGVSAVGIGTYRFNPDYVKAPDWPGLLNKLEVLVTEDDVVVYNFPDPGFLYYYDGAATSVVLPSEPNADVDAVLNELLANYESIWFLPQPTPTWDPDQVVRAWLDSHAQLKYIHENQTGNFIQYVTFEGRSEDIATSLDIQFGEFAHLAGYRLTPTGGRTVHAGDTVAVELFWKPLETTEIDYKVFVHLIGPPNSEGSPLWAQDDHPPHQGRASTTFWSIDTLLRDVYRLEIPEDAPAGEYQLTTGFYDPATGDRVTDITGNGAYNIDNLTLLYLELETQP